MPSGTRESGGGVPTPGACATAFPKSTRGFTLIELMITIAIAAILLSVAVPSYRAVIQNSRASALATNLTAAINTARSEAVKRSASVTLCASNDGATCGGTWQEGWAVFAGAPAAPGGLLQQWQALSTGTTVSSGTSAIEFNRLGGIVGMGNVAFFVAPEGCTAGDLRARSINLSATGRQRISREPCP